MASLRPHQGSLEQLGSPGSPFQNVLKVRPWPVSHNKPSSSCQVSGLFLLCKPPLPLCPEGRDQALLDPRVGLRACRALRSRRLRPLAQRSLATLGSCAVTRSIPREAWGAAGLLAAALTGA